MSLQLLTSCAVNVGVSLVGNLAVNALRAAGHYRPNTKLLPIPSHEYEVTLGLGDLLAEEASQTLISMRAEAKKALLSYGKKKIAEIESTADKFIGQVNSKLKDTHQKVKEGVDKLDVLADVLLYRMVKENGSITYSKNFYNEVKKEVGRCGVDISHETKTPMNFEEALEAQFGKQVDKAFKKEARKELKAEGKSIDKEAFNEKMEELNKSRIEKLKEYAEVKYGAQVDYRLDRLGYDDFDKSKYREKLLEEAVADSSNDAGDSVKFSLLKGFFSIIGNFIDTLFGLTEEFEGLFNGHLVSFVDQVTLDDQNKDEPETMHHKTLCEEEAMARLLVGEAWAEKPSEVAGKIADMPKHYGEFDISTIVGCAANGDSFELSPLGHTFADLMDVQVATCA